MAYSEVLIEKQPREVPIETQEHEVPIEKEPRHLTLAEEFARYFHLAPKRVDLSRREARGKVRDVRPCVDPRTLKGVMLEEFTAENIRGILVSLPGVFGLNKKEARMKTPDEFARYVSHHFQGRPPAEIERFLTRIHQGSQAFDLPEQLLGCMFMKESSLNPETRRSRAGAIGLSQVMPDTAKYISERIQADRSRPSVVTGPLLPGWDDYWSHIRKGPAPDAFKPKDLRNPDVAIGVGSYWARYNVEAVTRSSGHKPNTLEAWAMGAGGYNRGAGGIVRDCAHTTLGGCLKVLQGKDNCETYLYVARIKDCMQAGNHTPLTYTGDCVSKSR